MTHSGSGFDDKRHPAAGGAQGVRRSFLGDVHAFRGIAITFVVAAHTLSAFTWTSARGDTYHRALMILLQNSTVLFVFVAGYLFHHLADKFRYPNYLKTKLRNVITPYLLLSIPAIVYFTAFAQRTVEVRPEFYDSPIWQQVIEFYLNGAHLAPYWFIPMIALYYLGAPLFLSVGRSRLGLWALPPLIILSCLVPRGAVPTAAVHFISVYLAGILASRYRDVVSRFFGRRGILALSIVAIGILALIELARNNGTTTYLNFLHKMILCGLLLGVLRSSWSRLPAWVAGVADTSFGIYFLHSYIISGYKLMYTTYIGELPPGSILGVIVAAAIVLGGSHLVVRAAQRVFGTRSRMLIGA